MTTTAFDGAAAIVTGGAGGLGAATVRRLHREGLGVVIADLAEDQGKALAAELGPRAQYVRTDVTDEDSVTSALDTAGSLGVLRYAVVAHGGFGVAQRVVQRDGSPADFTAFTKTIDLYLNGTFNVLRLAAARIATAQPLDGGERGALVLTASIAGYEGQIGQAAYSAAKAGVIGLTLVSARDLSSVGVRVNTIAPGTMKTPIMESVGEEAIAQFAASVPFPKRLGAPDEFADAATFLLSNGYVNGEVLRLDGAQRFQPK
ncbi:SDR family oxidoreductase [[Mycobacterium] vasticus]|uniref:SDR family oxidoreductase n=1 Tax=[Mycobacterium] vasticus TaxID=2875777 RepID=A0ABU5YZT5_9MYCO|nr:SDR family oxidoreductase [Mycolicibacter sp. MYC017]MEB3070652.1 SDR family oxidoreductase [Mycolicibacter sp. MYC017]